MDPGYVLGAAAFVPSSVIEEQVKHAIGVGDYLELAWLTTSVSLVGGALGSLIESDEAVRNAAYRAHADERIEGGSSDGATTPDDDDAPTTSPSGPDTAHSP